jgi:putative NADH-flavin reductase
MKVLIIGATGRTGALVLASAVEAGHEVTALVRDRRKLAPMSGLEILEGDATVKADVKRAVAGQTAVLNAIGSRDIRHPVERESTAALIPAAIAAGANRLIVCSAFGVGETAKQASGFSRVFFSTVLGAVYADKKAADAMVQASALDWTLVYPTRLTDDPPVGDFQQVEHLERDGTPKISRTDVARFMVDQLVDPTWSRRIAIVSNHV